MWGDLGAHIEVVRSVRAFSGGRSLPGLIPRTVLRQGRTEFADAVGIVDVDDNGRGLPNRSEGWVHIQRRPAAAGQRE
jgi:hypothetical protein